MCPLLVAVGEAKTRRQRAFRLAALTLSAMLIVVSMMARVALVGVR